MPRKVKPAPSRDSSRLPPGESGLPTAVLREDWGDDEMSNEESLVLSGVSRERRTRTGGPKSNRFGEGEINLEAPYNRRRKNW